MTKEYQTIVQVEDSSAIALRIRLAIHDAVSPPGAYDAIQFMPGWRNMRVYLEDGLVRIQVLVGTDDEG